VAGGRRARRPGPHQRYRNALVAGLDAGAPHSEVFSAWIVKPAVRDVGAAGTETAARAALAELYATADTVDVPECTRLVRTLAGKRRS